MKTPPAAPSSRLILPALLLLGGVAAYRIWLAWQTTHGGALVSWLPGFCPVAALAVGSGWALPRRLALLAPLAVLGVTDLALTAIYGWQPQTDGGWAAAVAGWLVRYGVLFLLALWATTTRARRGRGATAALLGITAAGSALFYLATNSLSWLTLDGYARTFAGWAQALTVGLPGYLPSWIFFRNALVSDLLYSSLLLVALRLSSSSSRARVVSAPAALAVTRP